jgi:hypothetical protein
VENLLLIAVVVLAIAVVALYNKKEKFGLNQFSAMRAEAKAKYGENYKSALAGAKLAIKYMSKVNFTADAEAKTLVSNHSAAAAKFNQTAIEELDSAKIQAAELEKQAAQARKEGEEAFEENIAKANNEAATAKKYNDILADM